MGWAVTEAMVELALEVPADLQEAEAVANGKYNFTCPYK